MVLTLTVVVFQALAADLDAAVLNRELTAVFQPQIALDSGRTVAAEALCRWPHPEHGLVPPDRFIPLAEQTGAIHGLGRFMIEASLAAAARWSADGAPLEVSVNVSPAQLTARFVDELYERWRDAALPAGGLTLEITESMPVTDLAASAARLARLRDAGIGISLDDYGTGHASLAQIERLPVTEVKLDRSLIQSDDPRRDAEVAEVVEFAHARSLRVVAEGIETAAQLDYVRRAGCDRAQGYLLGYPMPADELGGLLPA